MSCAPKEMIMSIAGPILIVDDDAEDQDFVKMAIEQMNLPNEVKFFETGPKLLEYLVTTQQKPLLIISDVKLPGMNGLQLRQQINDDPFLRRKAIPFVFFSAAVSQPIINDAFEMTVQGFFEKGKSLEELQENIHLIVSYWKNSKHPSMF